MPCPKRKSRFEPSSYLELVEAADNVLYNGTNSLILLIFNVGHMAAYREIMKLNLPTECPGPSPSRLERLDYRHITARSTRSI